MKKKFEKSIFVFRRDLRLADNTALIEALRNSETVVPCFVFDKRQIGEGNRFRSSKAIQFMLQALEDLDRALRKKKSRLFFFSGAAEEVLPVIVERERCDALFLNLDYTPFSLNRDDSLKRTCEKRKIYFGAFDDALLSAPGTVLKKNRSPYSVFTAFYNCACQLPVAAPSQNRFSNFYQGTVKDEDRKISGDLKKQFDDVLDYPGGRKSALKILKSISAHKDYASRRDIPALPGTTRLSAHNKFGTCSIREIYWAVRKQLGGDHPLIRQLYWRDFFSHIAFHFPRVFKGPFHEKYKKISWRNNRGEFKRWCNGKTGFPIVDAGMRELNETGFMHNRVRMITASFLVKDLQIDWRWGEKYFAQKLVDYDPAVNNGNWQWAASTGCDAQPYFRVFNPWIQQKKYDPDCSYIKKWIPELASLSTKEIHGLEKGNDTGSLGYPRPIVDHREAREEAELLYEL